MVPELLIGLRRHLLAAWRRLLTLRHLIITLACVLIDHEANSETCLLLVLLILLSLLRYLSSTYRILLNHHGWSTFLVVLVLEEASDILVR